MSWDSGQQINPVNGPFNVLQRSLGGPSNAGEIYSLPYKKVMGSQIAVAITDNYGVIGLTNSDAWATVEISIVGYVAGFPTRLKRQAVRMMTGPLTFVVPYDAAFDRISIQARNISGGIADITYSNPQDVTLEAQVYIQPRGGTDLRSR